MVVGGCIWSAKRKKKKKICQPRNLDPGKLPFNSEGEIKTF